MDQPKIALRNVEDCRALVEHCLSKTRLQLSPDEHEELAAEGLAILVRLSQLYDPTKDRRSVPGRTGGFFGFALYLLPGKLVEAFHSMRPDHVKSARDASGSPYPDGRRRWTYLTRPDLSLDGDLETSRGQWQPGHDVAIDYAADVVHLAHESERQAHDAHAGSRHESPDAPPAEYVPPGAFASALDHMPAHYVEGGIRLSFGVEEHGLHGAELARYLGRSSHAASVNAALATGVFEAREVAAGRRPSPPTRGEVFRLEVRPRRVG